MRPHGEPIVSGAFARATGGPWVSSDRAGEQLSPYRPPVRELRFWLVQALVLAIAGIHVAIESLRFTTNPGLAGAEAITFVPTALYLIPVLYAALNFGPAGAKPTALWCIALALPNLLIFHSGLERAGEIFQLGMVVVIALFAGERVAREAHARRMADTALAASRASETKYRALFESSPCAILLLDPDGAVLEANPAAGQLFGDAPEALDGRPVAELVGTANGAALLGSIRDGQRLVPHLVVSRREGPDVDLEPLLTPLGSGTASLLVQVVLRDVTEERQRHAGLRAYAAHVLRAQEEERRRIAQELHDETVQKLILLCRELDVVQSVGGPLPPPVTAALRETRHSVESVVTSLRDFARDLRPPTLDDLGLVASVRRLVADVAERTEVEGECKLVGEERRLPPDVEIAAFRIAQQALRNVERHARATRVQAIVTFAQDQFGLEVRDDGVGFKLPTDVDLAATGNLGLLSMRERAETLGGKLTIHSEPGRGTTVNASIPTETSNAPGPTHRRLPRRTLAARRG